MTLRAVTAAVAALVTAATAPFLAVAQHGSTNASSEQIESGRVRISSGAEVAYSIRLLPLASFPALPATVAAQLEERKCLVPQTYEARAPENVVHASLERKGSSDWAVLCSVNGATTLYVFFQSQLSNPIMLRQQRDTEWLGFEALGRYGSAWGIARRSPSQIRQTARRLSGPNAVLTDIDHDGIEDAFIEKSSTTHYFQEGSWITLESPN